MSSTYQWAASVIDHRAGGDCPCSRGVAVESSLAARLSANRVSLSRNPLATLWLWRTSPSDCGKAPKLALDKRSPDQESVPFAGGGVYLVSNFGGWVRM